MILVTIEGIEEPVEITLEEALNHGENYVEFTYDGQDFDAIIDYVDEDTIEGGIYTITYSAEDTAGNKADDVAGDGTTTATLLAQAIIIEGLKNVAGANPMILRKGITEVVETVVEEIRNSSKSVEIKENITQVALISAADDNIGKLIVEAMEKVGKDVVVTVEESRATGTTLDVVEGMQFDRGYLSPYIVSDTEKMILELDNLYILVTDKKITNIQDLLLILEQIVQENKSLLIIADDIEGEALARLVVNKLRGTFNCVAVKAPGFEDRRKEMLEDITILTGREVKSDDLGYDLKDIELGQLGIAKL